LIVAVHILCHVSNDGPPAVNAPGYLTYFQKNIEVHSWVPVFTVV